MARWNRDRVHGELGKSGTRDPRGSSKGLTLVPSADVEIQSIGPSLPRVEAPDGWVKKIERPREGKVWVDYFHVWETCPNGQLIRRKKEKTLGPATKPKHEVLKRLSEYIAEHTGKLAKQSESIFYIRRFMEILLRREVRSVCVASKP